ncbi:hypothetical protein D5086_000782 [Populus alba]|uniref:Uncharacterized protein n=3 Tax=Populus TaxID=3689 RepID=A0ACC4CY13_POPAL|nr:hypothetical protein NC653_001016 [Populus alba x Populus x berolinensis]TKR97631.1 hypothetical protein D5086_0000212760 [Populus alba]
MALKLERDLIYSLKVREMSCLWTGFANYEHSKVPSGINYLQRENWGSKNPAKPKLSLFPFAQVKRLSSFGFGQVGMGKAWKRMSEGNHEVGDQNMSNPEWVTG